MNPFSQERPWRPNQDVFVNRSGELVIELELSHMRREDLTLELEGQRLHIFGKRSESADPAPDLYLEQQIPRGNFDCTVEIALEFALDQAKAHYQNGILRICVPPKEALLNRLHPPTPPLGGA
jgi:HSP20 family molecular chaperone IbpA